MIIVSHSDILVYTSKTLFISNLLSRKHNVCVQWKLQLDYTCIFVSLLFYSKGIIDSHWTNLIPYNIVQKEIYKKLYQYSY